MNIEIANRLVNLRKSNNLSQEALAEKLGISRQAVSKWERAEASPDTDNLILLARLYKVSLDELLKTEDEIPRPEQEEGVQETETGIEEAGQDSADGEEADYHIDGNGTYVNGEKRNRSRFFLHHFPITIIIIIAYLVIGCLFGAWHPGWLLFLLVPIWYSLVSAVENRNANYFAYPILATLIYLCLGFYWFLWHPGWIIYLTIPLYYSAVSWINSLMWDREERNGDPDEEE